MKSFLLHLQSKEPHRNYRVVQVVRYKTQERHGTILYIGLHADLFPLAQSSPPLFCPFFITVCLRQGGGSLLGETNCVL